MDWVDIVHGISGHCPWTEFQYTSWTMSTESIDFLQTGVQLWRLYSAKILLILHARKNSLSIAMATNQIQQFGLNSRNITVNCCQNTYNQIEIKAYFHCSHYKSMETLSCHSNENTWNIIYVEAKFINIYAKLQIHPPYGFWEEDFWIFIFRKFSLSVAMPTNQNQWFGQNSCGW